METRIKRQRQPTAQKSGEKEQRVQHRSDAEQKLRAVIAELPSRAEAEEMLRLCGSPCTLGELGLPEGTDLLERSAEFAPYVRNRLSLLKLIAAEKRTLAP